MLNFFSKLNDKNKVTMSNGNDIYIDILKIGKLINDLGTNKEKDLTEWSHKKDGTFKLNKTEIAIINSIEDETLEKAVSNFIKKYNYVDFMKDYTKYDFNTNTLMNDNKMYYIKDTERLKIFCHIVYLIYEITNILSNNSYLNDKNDGYLQIDLRTYYINHFTSNNEVFRTKTIIMLYNIMNNCFYNGVNYFISKTGDILYFTQYISSIAFFELYPVIRRLQNKDFSTSCMKECKVCHKLFYATRGRQIYCGDEKCLNVKNVDYVMKNKRKNKS